MQLEKARSFIMGKLEKELPKYLTYHNAQHTKDVLHYARHIGTQENISEAEMNILLTAALFHDTGFLEIYKNHEEVSCNFAKKYLPGYGYNNEQIEEVCRLIMATKIPQVTYTPLEQILCDADLAYFGTDKYFSVAGKLYKELKSLGIISNYYEWLNYQIEFIESHNYFTKSAVRDYNNMKEQNLGVLKTRAHEEKKRKHVHFDSSFFYDLILIIVGVVSSAFGLKGFLVPNHFFDGGMSGIALLINGLFHVNLSLVILLANLPFIFLSMRSINYNFAFKTLLSIILLCICVLVIPEDVGITKDKLLVSFFGGFFLGVGSGLAMRVGSVLDGVEVLALYTYKRTNFTVSEIILGLNILIFAVAAVKFGIETSLYSMLTYLTATKTLEYVVEGIEAYTGVTIISGKSDIIKFKLVNELGRGITVYKGERGFLPGKFELHEDCDIIFTVITRLELRKLRNLVSSIDPQAFVFASTIKEASGGIIKRRHID